MKNEKELWLNPEDVQQLLEGGLYWKDIETKLSPENSDSFRRQSISDELDIEEIIRDASQSQKAQPTDDIENPEQLDELRAILLGEERTANNAKDRNLEYSTHREKNFFSVSTNVDERVAPLAAAQEPYDVDQLRDRLGLKAEQSEQTNEQLSIRPNDETEVNYEERDRFMNLDSEDNFQPLKRTDSRIFDNDFTKKETDELMDTEETPKAFGGLKLILLLVVVALVTFGFWYYYLSH